MLTAHLTPLTCASHPLSLCLILLSVGFVPRELRAADFEPIWEIPYDGTTGQGAALGDVDGDGDVDAILTADTDGSILLLNNGNGVLTQAEGAEALPSAAEAAFGDVDDDGDLDVFFARYLNSCEVWLNDGNGVFSNSGQSIGSVAEWSDVKLVDVDGDEDLDAVVPTDSSTSANRIFLNDGDGVFTDSGQSLGMLFTRQVDAGDVDGDEDLDLVFASNGTNAVWLNDGNGAFTESSNAFGYAGTFGVELGDLDGDEDLDIWFANGQNAVPSEGAEVWLNDGHGVFTDSGQRIGTEYSFDVELVDLDGDGDLDAVEGTNSTQPNKVWINDGSGQFSDSGRALGYGRIISLVSGSLNGDARPDLLLSGNLDPSEVWLGAAAPIYIGDSGQRLGGGAITSVAYADVDGDGDLDAAMGAVGGNVRILFNDGTGELTEWGAALPNGFGNSVGSLAFGDFDGDDDPDLVVGTIEYSALADCQTRLWRNDGAGGFQQVAVLESSGPTEALVTADVDGDLDLDIVAATQMYGIYSGQNHVYLNGGGGSFTRMDELGSSYCFDLVLVDVDDDGDLDAALAVNNAPNEVWLNDGSGGFVTSGQALGASRTTALLAGDVDDDGDPDLVCGNRGAASVIYLNDGDGVFSASGASIGNGQTQALAWVDANGDDAPDLWIGNGLNGKAVDWIYQNDGSGQFVLTQSLPARSTWGLAAADFTGDGAVDVLLASRDGEHGLWSLPQAGVDAESYAGLFGLTGEDQGADRDPDGDGLPNSLEMAFNLNPAVADAHLRSGTVHSTQGLPVLRVEKVGERLALQARVIRRKNAPNLDYALLASPRLSSFVEPNGVEVTTQGVDDDYELATYTYWVPEGSEAYFGTVSVDYTEP
ncbi:hypothetical protein HNR46_003043 [Haloferula luteola]|uniref:FG-GAP repeat protein n=1 Tax=Haloferula luteola TaxID=595692 RepID=A0A840V455_9BACT|nr:VCBS repeat-containing protein [Haloferula luteola]MBB5352795.1 hypothetical protein [Haloferula luteola]